MYEERKRRGTKRDEGVVDSVEIEINHLNFKHAANNCDTEKCAMFIKRSVPDSEVVGCYCRVFECIKVFAKSWSSAK